MSGQDVQALDRTLARLGQAIDATRPHDWAEGYRAALEDVRRLTRAGPCPRAFEVSGRGFPTFGIVAESGNSAGEALGAFAKAALSSYGIAPLFLVRDPLERVHRIEVLPGGLGDREDS